LLYTQLAHRNPSFNIVCLLEISSRPETATFQICAVPG
jgi:hypothetical protein